MKMNEVATLDLKEILDRAYPTVPGGIKRFKRVSEPFPNFLNEASAKYAILLGAWHNDLIAAPEVKIDQVRLDIAILSDEREVVIIECKKGYSIVEFSVNY